MREKFDDILRAIFFSGCFYLKFPEVKVITGHGKEESIFCFPFFSEQNICCTKIIDAHLNNYVTTSNDHTFN